MKIKDIITDKQLDNAWMNANFGDVKKRDIIRYTLLKSVCGYGSGNTANEIVYDLDLTNMAGKLTKKGREYLYEAFRNGKKI